VCDDETVKHWGVRGALGCICALAAGVAMPAAALAAAHPATRPTTRPATHATRAPTARVARVGRAPAARRLALELPLRIDSSGLARFATDVSTPGSPVYRDYEPVAVLARRFGASPAARGRVLSYLRHAGATGVRIDPTGLFADATMRVGAAERLFGTDLDAFHADATRAHAAQSFLAPAARTRIPDALRGAVTGVVGMDTRPLTDDARPDLATAPPTSAYPTRSGTAAGCAAALAQPGFTPNQYLTAYGYNTLQAEGFQGQGERVALIEIDGFKASDVRAFAGCFGLPVPQIDAFGVGIGKALPPGGESTLDLELLDAAAPRLSEIDVYESRPLASQVLRSLTEPLAVPSRIPDVISASLSTCMPDAQVAIGQAGIDAVESTLQLAAATGVSVLAASGDDGSSACLTNRGQPVDQLAVNYPAASPWVTGVGGTNVQLSPLNTITDPALDQVVWNDEPERVGATGGGVSSFPRPAYQNGAQTNSHREVPDVSMLADPLPGYEIYCTASECAKAAGSDQWLSVGGTSAGTPLLAGGVALIDQELRRRGQQNLGFANPLLYRVAHSPTGALTISDVVSGSDDITGDVFGAALGCCTAHLGYDDASGLGSVNVAGLASAAAVLVPRQAQVGLTLPAQTDVLGTEHLLATVSCTTECLMRADATIRIGATTLTADSAPYELTRLRRRTIDIGLPGPVRAQILAALVADRAVTVTVYGAVVDAGGGIVRQTPGQTLHITG
jgi:kumamolisin